MNLIKHSYKLFFYFISLCLFLLGSPVKAENQNLYPIKKDGKWGYIDKAGKIVVKPKYELTTDFSEGMAVINSGGKETEGHYIQWPEGRWGGLWGFIDKHGKVAVTLQYKHADDFSDGLALVDFDNAWGYIDKTGKIVVKFARNNPYNLVGSAAFSEDLAPAFNISAFSPRKYGYIDKSGKIVINFKFDAGLKFSEGLAPACIDSNTSGRLWGYIDKTGDFVIKPAYGIAGDFRGGFAAVTVDGLWGIIDKKGIFIIKPTYIAMHGDGFSEGLLIVGDNSRRYIIDNTGREIATLPNGITDAKSFKEGLAPVGIWVKGDNNLSYKKWGYIDKTGKLIVEPKFDEAWDFLGGLGRVMIDRKFGYINKAGKYIWNPSN